MEIDAIVGVFVKLFLLLTPFFILSVFVTLTDGMELHARRKLAMRSTAAIWTVCAVVYFFGNQIFRYLGITLEAFQIGAGTLLLLSGIELVRGVSTASLRRADPSGDIAVVPLAVPYTVGPGTVGTLMVMGATPKPPVGWVAETIGITTAVLLIGILLFYADRLEKFLGRKGLDILSKLTGLFLCALAAQMIFSGIRVFLR